MNMILIPTDLKDILLAVRAAGGSPKLVGGCVRDHFLGKKPKDFDIEVSKLQPDKLFNVLEKFGKVKAVGKAFGVFKLKDYDFSMPRRDNKTGVGHKDFNVVIDPNMGLMDRARRRDLTWNSTEMDPLTGRIEDPFNGLQDLENKVMRATDAKMFVQDDLRALRVTQFIARFPQMVPDQELIQLCSQADLSHLPGERLWEEFRKLLLKGERPDLGLEFLKKCGLLSHFPTIKATIGCAQHPVFHAEGDVFTHTKMALRAATGLREGSESESDLVLMFAVLCHDLGKPLTSTYDPIKGRISSNNHDEAGEAPTREFLNQLRAPTEIVEKVVILVREHLKPFTLVTQGAGASAYRRLSRRMSNVPITLLAKIATADSEGRICYAANHQTKNDIDLFLEKVEASGVLLNQAKPPEAIVLGRHLLARGYNPGPEVGMILKQCRDVQDETGLKGVEEILKIVLNNETCI